MRRCAASIEREVRERLREVAEVLAGGGVDLLGVQEQRAGEREQLLEQRPGPFRSRRSIASAETSQNEQIVNVPSSPESPSSVDSTR